jgi:Bacterial PH domain/Short C-terminal domain
VGRRSAPVPWRAVPISGRLLGDDEEVLVDVHPHFGFWFGPAVVVAVAAGVAAAVAVKEPRAPVFVAWVLVAMVGIPMVWLGGRVARWYATSLVVTTTRLLYVHGILRRDLVQIRLVRVTEVHVTQSVFGRLVGAGRLVVEIDGEAPVFLDDVRRPRALQRVIIRQLDALTVGSRLAERPDVAVTEEAWDPWDGPTPPRGTYVGAPESDRPGDDAGDRVSVHGRLLELDDLRRRGIITDDEFSVKKTQLLRQL